MDQATDAPQAERTDDTRSPGDIAHFWQQQLALADQSDKDWIRDGQTIVQRYKTEKDATGSKRRATNRRFNILYSNTETLKAALYGKAAKPDVRRRFGDSDPAGKSAAEIIERGLIYCAESYDVDRPIQAGLHEYLLTGRGVMRACYEPIISQRPVLDPMTMSPIAGADGPSMQDYLADQKLYLEHVFWQDFRHSPARCWKDVWWVAFRKTMSREDLTVNKFANAADIPLNWQPNTETRVEIPEALKKAEVWEVWDKSRLQRLWIVKGYDKPLRVDPDPYGLSAFFPVAEPLFALVDTETLVPTPEFHVYQDQADDLDEIVSRISRLTKALKRRGVYNQAVTELKRLSQAGDNEFIPVANWAGLAGQGGLEKAFETEDISVIAVVLKELYTQREMLVQAIWEVVGIADIMRGQSNPNETLGAQELKANFGSNRMKKRQRAVQKWIRDSYKIQAEILAEHFEPQVLQEMTGQPIDPQVIQLLRTDKLRAYRIDIETDSTVFEDAAAEKQAVLEMIQAVAVYIQRAIPAIQQEPLLAPLLFEMLSLAVRSVKEGRRIEEVIEQTQQAIQQKIADATQNPQIAQPSPDVVAKLDVEKQKLAADQQERDRRYQLDVANAAHAATVQEHQHALAQDQHGLAQDQHQFDRHVQDRQHNLALDQHELAVANQNHQHVMDQLQFEDGIDARTEAQTGQAAQQTAQQQFDRGTQRLDLQGRGVKFQPGSNGAETVVPPEQVAADQATEAAGKQDEVMQAIADALNHMAEGFQSFAKVQAAPRKLVRGPDGRASHVEIVQ